MTDVRVGEIIEQRHNGTAQTNDKIVIIGFPHHEGVRRNGGRLGAASGPATFRTMLKRTGTIINSEYNIDCSALKIVDLGDIPQDLHFDKSHQQLQEKVTQAISVGAIPFVIGGGNDESYSNAMGLLNNVKDRSRVAVINIDAHLDVREQKEGLEHSGSPFRLLLETDGFEGSNFIEFAAQGAQCSKHHASVVTDKYKGSIYWLSELREKGPVKVFEHLLNTLDVDHIFVSFDLDSVQGADAPGVSCPSPIGLTAMEALEICRIAGAHCKVSLFDLSEFNPTVEDYRTGKLVTQMFYFFTLGVATR
jgi:formiminoglutamase